MGSKALLIMVMFLATTLLICAEVTPKDFDENFDELDGKLSTNGVDESKYGFGGYGGRGWGYGGYGGYGGPWGGGYGGWGRGYGWGRGWGRGYGWGRGCGPYGCYYPHKHVETSTDEKSHN